MKANLLRKSLLVVISCVGGEAQETQTTHPDVPAAQRAFSSQPLTYIGHLKHLI